MFLRRELVLLAMGDAVPVCGSVARVLGEVELIETMGTDELKGSLLSELC